MPWLLRIASLPLIRFLPLGRRGTSADRNSKRLVERLSKSKSANDVTAEVGDHGRAVMNNAVFISQEMSRTQGNVYNAVVGPGIWSNIKEQNGRAGAIRQTFHDSFRERHGDWFIGHDGVPRYQVTYGGNCLVLTEPQYHSLRDRVLSGEAA